MHYDWLALLVFLATLFGVSFVGRRLAFMVPALAEARAMNREADRVKLSRQRFREAVKRNNIAGLATNAVIILAVLPFFLDLSPRPLWRHALDVAAVLLVYDFFYYLTHRFLFHGRALRKIHSLHHQAHAPTYIDGLYVHPVETMIGLVLFLGSIPLVAAVSDAPLHAVSAGLATVVFTQWNQVNHTWVHLPRFPYRTLDWVTSIHAAHHVDMNRGNYATITMLYDWLFGTLEKPVSRTAP